MYVLLLGLDSDGLTKWAQTHLLRITLILLVALVVIKLASRMGPWVVRTTLSARRGEVSPDDKRRAQTLAAVATYSFKLLVLVVAALMILSELGFDLTPLLASIGFVSVFVGLATQTIVRDYIRGFAIVGGKYYVVGDRVSMGGVTGTVDELTLRRTVLHGDDGAVHFVAHSDSDVVTRHVRGPGATVLRLVVPFGADAKEVTKVLKDAVAAFAADERWKESVIGIPEVGAVQHFEETGAVIPIAVRLRDELQWSAVAELQRRTREALEESGLLIPKAGETPASPEPRDGPPA